MADQRRSTSILITDPDTSTQQAAVDANGALSTTEVSTIDSNNSTTSTLLASNTYTGTGTEITQYAAITILVEASHDSGTDGLSIEYSSDNTNWDVTHVYTYVAADGGITYTTPCIAQYFRVQYTNGGTNQTHFRLESILHAKAIVPSGHRLSNSESPEEDGALVKSAIIAQASGAGDFVPVQASAGGVLKVDMEEIAGTTPSVNTGNADAGTQRVVLASDQPVVSIDDNAGSITIDGTVTISDGTDDVSVITSGADATSNTSNLLLTGAFGYMYNGTTWDRIRGDTTNGLLVNLGSNNDVTVSGTPQIQGTVAHDGVDADNPVKIGAKALTFGSDPTEVASADRTDLYATRAGQLLTLGGHPNVLSRQFNITDADGAQTNLNILNAVVASGDSCVVLGIDVVCDNANTGDTQCRIGFGTASTPGNDALDVILSHPGIAAGSGISKGHAGAIIGFGASDEELRMTCEDPVGGSLDVVVHYFIMPI